MSPKQFLLKNPHTNLIRLTPSGLQHWDSSLKGTSGRQGGMEVSGESWGTAFSQIERQEGAIVLFSEPSHHRATELAG